MSYCSPHCEPRGEEEELLWGLLKSQIIYKKWKFSEEAKQNKTKLPNKREKMSISLWTCEILPLVVWRLKEALYHQSNRQHLYVVGLLSCCYLKKCDNFVKAVVRIDVWVCAHACVYVHLLRWEVVQLDEDQEVHELSITGAVFRVYWAECKSVELTELNRERPLLSCLIRRSNRQSC